MYFQTPGWDMDLYLFINQTLHSTFLNEIMPFFSSRAAFMIVMACFLIWIVVRKKWKTLVMFLVLLASMGVVDFTSNQIKHATSRVRPAECVAGTYFQEQGHWERRPLDYVRTDETGRGFPSSHAANYMCLAVLTMLMWPIFRPWLIAFPLITGFSRVYLGKHFPTDVIGGWLFGLLIAGVVWLIWKHFLAERLARTFDSESLHES